MKMDKVGRHKWPVVPSGSTTVSWQGQYTKIWTNQQVEYYNVSMRWWNYKEFSNIFNFVDHEAHERGISEPTYFAVETSGISGFPAAVGFVAAVFSGKEYFNQLFAGGEDWLPKLQLEISKLKPALGLVNVALCTEGDLVGVMSHPELSQRLHKLSKVEIEVGDPQDPRFDPYAIGLDDLKNTNDGR